MASHFSSTIQTLLQRVQSPLFKTLKIPICGLPLSEGDSTVHEMLDKVGVKPTSKILNALTNRHPETMTSILNGTMFLYIEPLSDQKVLPMLDWSSSMYRIVFEYTCQAIFDALL